MRRARRQARANRRLRALVRRLHGCLTDLPSTSARILTLRAGTASRPGLSPGATARVLGVSAGREAHLERVALSSLRAAGRAGCGAAGTFTILAVAATPTLVSSSPVFSTTAGGASGASSPAAGSLTQTGVTRGSVHRPSKGGAAPTRTVDRAASAVTGTPAWALILALGLLALGGAAAIERPTARRRRRRRRRGRAASRNPGPASAFAALPAVGQSPPRDAVPTSSPADPAPAPGTGPEPAQSTALSARTGNRQRGRLAAVAVTTLASGLMRLLSRRRTGRH